MARLRQTQTNFSAGQLDSRMLAREDLSVYQNGAEALPNNRPLVQGGVARRPSSLYGLTLQDTGRLERFQFNETQLYLLFFSDARLDVYDEDMALVQTHTGQPWGTAQLWEMRITISGDTILVCHEDFMQQRILRTGAATFTISDFPWETHSSGYPIYQPYYKFADTNTTLTPSATTGAITLTASAASFVAAHVGSMVRYKGKTCEITGYTSSTVVSATVQETLSGTAADIDWDENVFCAANGYARSCQFHGQRTWFGGSGGLPSHMFGSNKSAFFKFDVGTALDTDSIQAPLGADSINEIQHLHSSENLIVLTDQAVLYVPESDSSPITPLNFKTRGRLSYGVGNVVPWDFDGATLYVQDTGKTVRELVWSDVHQSYSGDALSFTADDLVSGVQDLAVLHGTETDPEQLAFFVNSDGSLAVYHGVRTEKIAAWFPWSCDGVDKFISVAELNNEIYVVVERLVNAATVYYLEKFDWTKTVDCHATGSLTSGTTWGGFTHLIAETVSAMSGDSYLGDYVVDGSGEITVDEDVASLHAGLNFTRTITTLPVSGALSDGPISGQRKRISQVVMYVYEALDFQVSGNDFIVREVNEDLSNDPTAKTGRYHFYLLGWSREGQITISQADPVKFTLLGLWMEIRA